ncbi:glutaminyl-peptide cyclotransferase-like isoform X2 [Tachypleus tridentatus]|uniref:glutaminyl-peptide cyclotransferase-like isoform X2 n=1 Tax=Tachypleus tridentatus TaxID=6853 RepID=UPI003FD51A55
MKDWTVEVDEDMMTSDLKHHLWFGVAEIPTEYWHHESKNLSDSAIHTLTQNNPVYYTNFNTTLDVLLIPRVPGTPGHKEVKKFIIETMKSLDWDVEEDNFIAPTPFGKKHFSNIMSTLDPGACEKLVLACHYDSKYNREYTFVGATDSAVPCTMMIHLAQVLDKQLKQQRKKNKDLTLQFIFFDGEEALKQWSKSDSLYGSRHLAELLNHQPFPDEYQHCSKNYATQLDRIHALVLLDLVGVENPRFYSYFEDTYSLYKQLVNIENRLNDMKELEVLSSQLATSYFKNINLFSFVQDDHIPFLERGVSVVHLIPSPFPYIWHRDIDDREHLHHPTINNLNKIFRVFVAQYLHLDVPETGILNS